MLQKPFYTSACNILNPRRLFRNFARAEKQDQQLPELHNQYGVLITLPFYI